MPSERRTRKARRPLSAVGKANAIASFLQTLDNIGKSTMADQQIRDRNQRLLATIKTLSSGKQEIRDPSLHLLGTFDPKSNETRDANLRLVAKGNVLPSLIRS